MPRKGLLWKLLPAFVLSAIVAALATDRFGILIGTTIGTIAAGIAAWASIRPLRQFFLDLRQAADEVAAGRYEGRIYAPDIAEAAELAEAVTRSNVALGRKLDGAQRINHEQEAVLAGMAEGVLAVDHERRIISLNRTASRMLGALPIEAIGRDLREVVRNPDLLRQVEQLLTNHAPFEGDLVLRQADERILQIRGTLLKDTQGKPFGAVVVLDDVTRLRRLESMRRDFAANVSHELRTPITSIKGFVETILDGATPEDAERFLRIVSRQADRLEAIIDDLLSLSKIEKDAEASEIILKPTTLYDVVVGAIHDCEFRAAERNIGIDLEGDPKIRAEADPQLLQQAVQNLLENAVKYSDPDATIRVVLEATPDEVRLSVVDRGCGIAPEYHDRLFERFYRVDKARSRKVGGTGLGLAIVKHIVLAHHGRVTVQSAVGKGSTFTIHLPLPAPAATPLQTA